VLHGAGIAHFLGAELHKPEERIQEDFIDSDVAITLEGA